MVDKVIDGICRAIKGEFGEEYHIYTEKVEQRFTRPCFFVEVTKSSTELFRGDRYYMENGVLVTYYPQYVGKNSDMAVVSERLSHCLELIEADGEPLRCSSCRHTFDKDGMSTDLSYNFFVRIKKVEDTPEIMEEYTLK